MNKNLCPETTVQKARNNQYLLTVPMKYIRKDLISKGDKFKWNKSKDKFILTKVDE